MALVAVVAIGLIAFVLTQPKKGTLEWHKNEYQATRMRLAGYECGLIDRVRRVYARVLRKPTPPLPFAQQLRLRQKELNHEAASLELGFLQEREVPVHAINWTNWGAVLRYMESEEGVARCAKGHLKGIRPGIGSQRDNTNLVIQLIAPSNDLPKWEELVRTGSIPR